MKVIEELVSKSPLEVAGSRSAARFNYQKNWALSHLLKKHNKGEKYVFAFEFHDDIIILNNEVNPSQITFVQVKTSRGKNWTIHRLTKRPSGKQKEKMSILGKLMHHKTQFKEVDKIVLKFVTDAYFSFDLSANNICLKDLPSKETKSINDGMILEFPLLSSIELDDFYLVHSSLSLDGHEIHIKGKIQEFFKEKYGNDHGICIEAWYKTITTEIRVRNDCPQTDIKNMDDFISKKCITRSYIEEELNTIVTNIEAKSKWSTIKTFLTTSKKIKLLELMEIEKYWKQYKVDILDVNNSLLKDISTDIKFILNNYNIGSSDLYDSLNYVYTKLNKVNAYDRIIFPKNYIFAVTLWMYCEHI